MLARWLVIAGVLLVNLPARLNAENAPSSAPIAAARPAGFEVLLEPQQAMVDVYYGGANVGQAMLWFSPGDVRFADVDAVLAMLDDVADRPAVRAALGQVSLDPHIGLVCERSGESTQNDCGRLPAGQTGVIFDQRHFRVDVSVAASLLVTRPALRRRYLTPGSTAPALVGFVSGTLVGEGGTRDYDLQTRLIASSGNARLRAEASYSYSYGALVDTLAAEIDRLGIRYSVGYMWAPGLDLIGRRKLLGVGVRSSSIRGSTGTSRSAVRWSWP